MGYVGRKIIEKMQSERIQRTPNPAHSLNLSPCDSWISGFPKHRLKEQALSTSEEIFEAITVTCQTITFQELQSAFFERIQGLTWVIGNINQCFNK
jgi:hypothetical protein